MSYSTVADVSQIWDYVREEMENLKAEVRQKLQDLEREVKQDTSQDIKVVESRYQKFESDIEERIQRLESRLFSLRIQAEAAKRKMTVDDFLEKAISSFLSRDTHQE